MVGNRGREEMEGDGLERIRWTHSHLTYQYHSHHFVFGCGVVVVLESDCYQSLLIVVLLLNHKLCSNW